MEKTIVSNVTAYISKDEQASMSKTALLTSFVEMGVTPADIKGGGRFRTALVDAMSTLFIGKRELERARKLVKAGTSADDVEVKFAKAFSPVGQTRTETFRYVQRDVSSRLTKLANALEAELNKPTDTDGKKERTKKNRTAVASDVHKLAEVRQNYLTLLSTPTDSMTKAQQERARAIPANKRDEVVAAFRTLMMFFPADVRKSEGVKL